jgi:hypothetical protein
MATTTKRDSGLVLQNTSKQVLTFNQMKYLGMLLSGTAYGVNKMNGAIDNGAKIAANALDDTPEATSNLKKIKNGS